MLAFMIWVEFLAPVYKLNSSGLPWPAKPSPLFFSDPQFDLMEAEVEAEEEEKGIDLEIETDSRSEASTHLQGPNWISCILANLKLGLSSRKRKQTMWGTIEDQRALQCLSFLSDVVKHGWIQSRSRCLQVHCILVWWAKQIIPKRQL